jgi:hypothetical protein
LYKQRLENGFYNEIPIELRNYLVGRLTADSTSKHINAGNDVTEKFEDILEQRLTKPDGKKHNIAVIPTGEIIDSYGRLLAYMAP